MVVVDISVMFSVDTSRWSPFVMVVVDISWVCVLGRRPLLGGAHSSWSWLTSLVFSVDGHFSVEPIRHGPG